MWICLYQWFPTNARYRSPILGWEAGDIRIRVFDRHVTVHKVSSVATLPHKLCMAEALHQGRDVAPLNPGLRDLGESPSTGTEGLQRGRLGS